MTVDRRTWIISPQNRHDVLSTNRVVRVAAFPHDLGIYLCLGQKLPGKPAFGRCYYFHLYDLDSFSLWLLCLYLYVVPGVGDNPFSDSAQRGGTTL